MGVSSFNNLQVVFLIIREYFHDVILPQAGRADILSKLFTFAKISFMINSEQIKDLLGRREALRRYL